jgi:hypothetical protein
LVRIVGTAIKTATLKAINIYRTTENPLNVTIRLLEVFG